jgi:hypothetical protein
MKFDPNGCCNILLCTYVLLEKIHENMSCLNNLFKTMNPYNVFNLMNVFEYSILKIFISNHTTCFYNIFETFSQVFFKEL